MNTSTESPLQAPKAIDICLFLTASLFVCGAVQAASSDGCEGGGFTVLGKIAPFESTVAAGAVGASFLVKGKYVEFEVDAATFGIRNYTMTGAPNSLDLTAGVRTPVFASKTPNLKGVTLRGAVDVELKEEDMVLEREGPGVTMKIQAKDCAQGGIFQMEVERSDSAKTVFTHTLAPSAFYFDNRKFRNREGDVVPFRDTTLVVGARINFGNDASPKFVGRDSPQVAERLPDPTCTNNIRTRTGTRVPVLHCGGVSRWEVASGGRMGQVMGEDSVEVAPPATDCTKKCQARNRTRGAAVVLGFPFPVAGEDRLTPRTPTK